MLYARDGNPKRRVPDGRATQSLPHALSLRTRTDRFRAVTDRPCGNSTRTPSRWTVGARLLSHQFQASPQTRILIDRKLGTQAEGLPP